MRVSLVTDNRFHEIHRSSYVQSRHKIHHGFIYSSNSEGVRKFVCEALIQKEFHR